MNTKKEESEIERSLRLFQAFLDNTPKEKLDEIIREVEGVGTEGPTVEEYFQGVAQDYYTIAKENVELKAKISHLQSTLEAADEVIQNAKSIVEMECDSDGDSDFNKSLNKYNRLKNGKDSIGR